MSPRTAATATVRLGDILEEFEERLEARSEPEVLTLTEKLGFVLQRERFNKRLAVSNTSNYKVIGLHDIAFNPYLLWAGAVAQNTEWPSAIISPLYPTFRVRTGYDPRFVNYVLHSGALRARYDGISFGSVPRKRRATVADFLNLPLPIPPSLSEQRRMAEILDKADALRARRRAALAQLETLTQAIFLDMFGDPAMNAKGWPLRTVGDLVESASYGTSAKAGPVGEFPVVRMNNITRTGEIDLTVLKYMDVPPDQRERYLLRPGDLLFNRTNSPELVGKTGVFRDLRPMAYAGYLIRLRMKDENDSEYLKAFLNTGYSKRVLRGMCKSIIGMANINATELRSISVPQPPASLQCQYARRVGAVEPLKAAHLAARVDLDALFASLQNRAFRGEL